MIRRILILLSAVLVMVAGALPALAQMEVSIPGHIELEADSSGLLAIPIQISNPAGKQFYSYALQLFYPKKLLKFKKTDALGTLTEGWQGSEGNEVIPGEVSVGGFDLSKPVSGSGVLLHVEFEMTGSSGSDSLKIKNLDDGLRGAVVLEGFISLTPKVVAAVEGQGSRPQQFALMQNYPNPFNPETRIVYALPSDSNVKLIVYDILGNRVKTLADGWQTAGLKETTWDGTNERGFPASSGMYFYRLTAGEFTALRRMFLVR